MYPGTSGAGSGPRNGRGEPTDRRDAISSLYSSPPPGRRQNGSGGKTRQSVHQTGGSPTPCRLASLHINEPAIENYHFLAGHNGANRCVVAKMPRASSSTFACCRCIKPSLRPKTYLDVGAMLLSGAEAADHIFMFVCRRVRGGLCVSGGGGNKGRQRHGRGRALVHCATHWLPNVSCTTRLINSRPLGLRAVI